jgi:hypothetical protein
MEETVHKHLEQLLLQETMAGRLSLENLDNPGPAVYAKYADRGNHVYGSAQCAHMAGILYKNHVLSNVQLDPSERTVVSTTGGTGDTEGVLEMDELAYKYLLQASEGGLAVSMQSLAELYEKGQGVRKNKITANDWLWNSVLLGSSAGMKYLDNKSLLPLELGATLQPLNKAETRLVPMQTMSSCGPNLASLVTHFAKTLMTEYRFSLPPFANAYPTLHVGGEIHQGGTVPVPVIGSHLLGQIAIKTTSMEQRRGNRVDFTYGRRGTAKAATAQTYGATNTRLADSFLYQVPPAPQCQDEYFGDELDAFLQSQKDARLMVHCAHCENERETHYECRQCISAAQERLRAVSRGSLAISLFEILPARGRTALWLNEEGIVQSETFKVYSRGEAETTLAVLVACEPRLAHPLFVAQDPNFLFPLITYHGTVRAALEYVAPHVDWNERLGATKPAVDHQTIVNNAVPGSTLARCGNTLCTKLEEYDRNDILRECSACGTRPYCSEECMAADWNIHKHECSGKGFQNISSRKSSSSVTATLRPLQEDDNVVIHGLQAKPKYNGKVGTISGPQSENGRYPVKLLPEGSSLLAIKPVNMYQLGISLSRKEGKPTKVTCSSHRKEMCEMCFLDFGVVNHLFKLCHLGQVLTESKIEEITELKFAGIDIDATQGVTLEPPIECAGLVHEKPRFVLKSLLAYAQGNSAGQFSVSMDILVAINGLCCYSARKNPVVVPYAVKQLQKLHLSN